MKKDIKLFVVDVDGTMTDGGIFYDEQGNEIKKFCTRDAAGFFATKKCGIKTMVLTGRECAATTRRMAELQVDYLYQNIKDKERFLKNFITEKKILREQVAYIGDDLNDLPSMRLAGWIGCPADSCKEVKEIADYISVYSGGCGAVRDVIEKYLRDVGKWDYAISQVYGIGC